MPTTTRKSNGIYEHPQRPLARYLAFDSLQKTVLGEPAPPRSASILPTPTAPEARLRRVVRMRQVALSSSMRSSMKQFGDFTDFYEEGSYQDSVFRDGLFGAGGSASCSTPEGLKDCSSDSDRVGPYNSAPIWEPGMAVNSPCSFECLPEFQASTTPIDNSCVPEGPPAVWQIFRTTHTRGCDTAINGSCTRGTAPVQHAGLLVSYRHCRSHGRTDENVQPVFARSPL